MYLSWITIGVLILEVFWAGRLWEKAFSTARTDGQMAGAATNLRDLLTAVGNWEEEHRASLEEISEELGGSLEEPETGGGESQRALPLPPAVRRVLHTLPGQVAALLGREVWNLPLAEVPEHLKAFQECVGSRAGWQADTDGDVGEDQRAEDRDSPMRPVVRRLQRARDVLRRLEGWEEIPTSEPLDAALGAPVCDVPLGILALALIAEHATSSLQQLRQEMQAQLLRAKEHLEPEPLDLLVG
jgi:hypothetical protein